MIRTDAELYGLTDASVRISPSLVWSRTVTLRIANGEEVFPVCLLPRLFPVLSEGTWNALIDFRAWNSRLLLSLVRLISFDLFRRLPCVGCKADGHLYIDLRPPFLSACIVKATKNAGTRNLKSGGDAVLLFLGSFIVKVRLRDALPPMQAF